MHAVGDVRHRYLDLGPPGEERLEEAAAHGTVQAADAVDRRAAANGEVRHVERLVRVVRTLPSEREEPAGLDAQPLLGVLSQVPLDERRREAIEAGRHRGVGGEEGAGPRDRQGHVEGLAALFHEGPGPLQDRERRMPLVEMTDLGLEPEGTQKPPPADPQQEFLAQAQLGAAPVQLAGDAADGRWIGRVVTVQQVEHDPPDLNLPGPEPDRIPRQLDREPEPFAARTPDRGDRELGWLVVGIELLLAPIGGDHLPEVPLLIEKAYADHRHREVARRLELIPGHVPEAARIDGQRLAQGELHAEIGHAAQGRLGVVLREPRRRVEVFAPLCEEALDPLPKARARDERPDPRGRGSLENEPRVMGEGPELGIELTPELVAAVIPRPAKIEREFLQRVVPDVSGPASILPLRHRIAPAGLRSLAVASAPAARRKTGRIAAWHLLLRMAGPISSATAVPSAPTRGAPGRATLPVPHATCRTRSPSFRAADSRGKRVYSIEIEGPRCLRVDRRETLLAHGLPVRRQSVLLASLGPVPPRPCDREEKCAIFEGFDLVKDAVAKGEKTAGG